MSALQELDVRAIESETSGKVIKVIIANLFWNWYKDNKDRKLTTVKFWFIKKTIYLRDLENVFELLFGPA